MTFLVGNSPLNRHPILNCTASRRALIRAAAAFICAAILCACVRTAASPEIPPPYDPLREQHLEEMDSLMSNPDLILGKSEEYTLGAGDVISVTLLGRPDILGNRSKDQTNTTNEGMTFTLTENPMLVFPLIGSIKVHGKSAEQLQKELTYAYMRYVKNPWIIVTIDKYYRNQVAVLGSVNTPGKYPWEYGDTVLDSLFKAGGLAFTTRGGLPPGRFLHLYREKVSQKERAELPLEELIQRMSEGKQIVTRTEFTIPIEEFVLSGNLRYNVPVRPGDILFIPTAGAVSVQGHVRAPGVAYMGPSLHTVTEAVTERGGLRYGARSIVEIVRTLPDGEPVTYFISVRDIITREERDFLLQDGDKIFVFRHPIRYPLEVIGSVFRATVATGVSATYSPAGVP